MWLRPYAFMVILKDVNEVLRATIFLDALTGVERGRCANPDCQTPIFRKSRGKRRFCDNSRCR